MATNKAVTLIEQKKIQIIELRKKDIKSVLQIADMEFGKGYFDKNTLLNPNVFTHVVLLNNNDVIGFACGIVQNIKNIKTLFTNYPPFVVNLILKYKNIGITKSLAIRNSLKHNHIGTALFAKRHVTFKNKGAEIIIMPGWQKPNGITSIDGIARRFGFTNMGVVKNFFYKDSLQRNYKCPVCGNPPCKCNVIVYKKEM